ncbi:MAG TPA: DUF2934 domain-containing protein [Nitrospiraceae bacterium]|jgi:hypothetical protein
MEPLKLKKPAKTKTPNHHPQPDSPASSVSEDLHARITTRAREIYEQRIRQGALDDWLQAEREILKEKRSKSKQQ